MVYEYSREFLNVCSYWQQNIKKNCRSCWYLICHEFVDKKKKKNKEGVDAEKLLEIPESVRKEPCDHEDEICRLVQENEGLRAKVEYS